MPAQALSVSQTLGAWVAALNCLARQTIFPSRTTRDDKTAGNCLAAAQLVASVILLT